MTHTRGPWAVWPMGRILAITCTGSMKPHPSEGMHVAAVHMPETNKDHDELWMANARLIAAAPDLLEALESVLGNCLDSQGLAAAHAKARAAIAKATGETP